MVRPSVLLFDLFACCCWCTFPLVHGPKGESCSLSFSWLPSLSLSLFTPVCLVVCQIEGGLHPPMSWLPKSVRGSQSCDSVRNHQRTRSPETIQKSSGLSSSSLSAPSLPSRTMRILSLSDGKYETYTSCRHVFVGWTHVHCATRAGTTCNSP